MSTYLLVHGGFVGSWIWDAVAARLRALGHEVLAPTLTAAAPEVGLNTHIGDVVAVLRRQAPRSVVLVGHSYGGMVIAGAADRAPDRIARVIYLDAFVPRDGETLGDLLGPETAAALTQLADNAGDGWKVPCPFPPEALGLTEESQIAQFMTLLVPQPILTMQEPVRLGNPFAATLPSSFVYCSKLPMGFFDEALRRARERGWSIRAIDAPHAAPLLCPELVADSLLDDAQVAVAFAGSQLPARL